MPHATDDIVNNKVKLFLQYYYCMHLYYIPFGIMQPFFTPVKYAL